MKRVESFQDNFRHPSCGHRIGDHAEPDAAAGFFLAPFMPSMSEVDQQPAAASFEFAAV